MLHKSFGLSGNMSVRTLPSPLTLDDFELGVTLGTGSFGRVRFCTHKVRLMETLYLLSLKFNILTHAIYFSILRIHIPQNTGSFWAMKMLKKSEVIRLQQVSYVSSIETVKIHE